MEALAASCEELRARTGNPPLRQVFHMSINPVYICDCLCDNGMAGQVFIQDGLID